MPAHVCPHCQSANLVPDGWHAPGYTCHHCQRQVPILYPAASKADPLADMVQDRDDGIPIRRRTARRSKRSGSSFADGFGWTMGEQTAKLLFGLVGTAITLLICYVVWMRYFHR